MVDMVVHGDGPGARWAAAAAPGDTLEAIGPRGQIVVDEAADWHLFVGDETALPGMAAMIESLPPQVPGVMIVELPARADGHDPEVGSDQDVQVTWIERATPNPGDAARLVAAVASVALPSGRGRAYVAGEMRVARAIATALAARGLERDQIATKSYWRRGEANASHGEPLDPDRPMRARPDGPNRAGRRHGPSRQPALVPDRRGRDVGAPRVRDPRGDRGRDRPLFPH